MEEVKLKPIKLTGSLPNILRLQLGIEYMCTLNQDVPDSIVNGTTGILRKICYDSKLKPILIFLELNDDSGKKKMSESLNIIKLHQASPNCVPFSKIKRSCPVGKDSSLSIQREQYSWVPSKGLTINKSQGSTYDEVTVSLYRECEFKATKAQLLKNPKATVIRNMYID